MKALWVTAALVLLADQLTKTFVIQHMAPDQSLVAIPNVLWWTYVENTHGAFGLFGNNAVLLVGMAIVVLAIFWFAFRDSARESLIIRLAFGGIVGGAIGNIIDRVHYHFVVDFIDLRWWPVFNIADSCVTIGVAVLVLASLRRDMRSRTRQSAP